jgi:UDP-4-amino-4-deoxy-L-arabinose formyltransferase/UDP-glucuronic acid dehydrogenase (UDP-4-keto-hexauronic acid decarboxylating)
MHVLVLGANGFIGSSLVRAILERTGWRVSAIDLAHDKLSGLADPRLEFEHGDVTERQDWVDRQIRAADVVVPLVAIATPGTYVRDPLRTFELTFAENLRVVRECADAGTRIVFPSSSEVYGMCPDEAFVEDRSQLVLGPIVKQRWIYAASKQLLERVIWAHGNAGRLRFTVFRPFNWIGPALDDPPAKDGDSRVIAEFLANLARRKPIRLVDGGRQKRCFTYVDDGIDCLLRILENREGRAEGQIFNVGNPANECSMAELAVALRRLFLVHGRVAGPGPEIVEVSGEAFYGPGYEDVARRKPSIARVRTALGWEPRVGLDEALERTVVGYVENLRRRGSPLVAAV